MKSEKISTQELPLKRPRIGKRMLISAIAISSVAILFFSARFFLHRHDWALRYDWALLFWLGVLVIPYLLLSWSAVIFYLTREEQAVAAKAWGILGGFALTLYPPHITILPFIMAIGGAMLALRRPKLAGRLMLAGAAASGAALLFLLPLLGWVGGREAERLTLVATVSCLLAISFLIPGGILALTSRKGQVASKKMAIVVIAALFALGPGLLFALLYFELLL